ncbi:hypothetical protein FQV37_2558 [Psychrobacter nivimaris]|uniref:T4 recombination endonuclease VII dimerisation domain-containing protein n=1 Tax=Psychrobacter nivimaris TaxID=281738 RepID=A0A6N7C2G7_9GAMM|nr:hypothetical protein [Psychrobacter nivimaris]KAF0569533.1 hypothetical protein FQV37_2558 [Psychrobacter nivimaris]|tara:strand:+ start:159 stop:440 length:282 start_codon:yes stop_codon:yes gene_type:complete
MSKYIAKQSVGRFKTGEVVEGLTEKRAKFLLEQGVIVEAEAVEGEDVDTGEGGEVVDLDKLTKAELTALLDEEEIDYNDSDTKAELIARFPKD